MHWLLVALGFVLGLIFAAMTTPSYTEAELDRWRALCALNGLYLVVTSDDRVNSQPDALARAVDRARKVLDR